MKKKIVYTDEPMGDPKVIPNFLPPPEVLARGMRKTKVTLSLGYHSLDYFKTEAKKHKVPYQALIRQVLDEYVARASKQK